MTLIHFEEKYDFFFFAFFSLCYSSSSIGAGCMANVGTYIFYYAIIIPRIAVLLMHVIFHIYRYMGVNCVERVGVRGQKDVVYAWVCVCVFYDAHVAC